MTELITLLSTGKGTWTEVIKLINAQEWDRVIIVTNDFGATNFRSEVKAEMVVINPNESIELIIGHLVTMLKPLVSGTEVALNMISGSGKEHMALLSSLLKLGLGIRLVTVTPNGLKEV